MISYFYVFLGGGLGSLARFTTSKVITGNFQHINPLATCVANSLACLVLGVFVYYANEKHNLPYYWKTLVVTGFCGGFSTFSTFSYETLELLRQGSYIWAGVNVTVSILLALLLLFFLSKASV